ncbi:ABC transporter permease [Yinghuangia soli]|uniref:ABC transporter permease n=1 Tax=Yinghuangia soli TaxID=2908204 RepID=A0AA41Q7J4_9ACTN|nr:ABC transporter permease [Yinghuangia soli]MCF2532958.1 ABC transporter permease [Yinghuangia soli]
MLRFFVRRFAGMIGILLVISLITFYLFFAASGPDDVVQMSCGRFCTEEAKAGVRHDLGLDKPFFEQYWVYMTGIVMGRDIGDRSCSAPCLGYSFSSREPVTERIQNGFPTTLSLAIGAIVLMILIGVGLGVIAAMKRGTRTDKVLTTVAVVAGAFQIFILGPLLLLIFVYETELMDLPKYYAFTDNPGKWATGLILPWICLMVIHMAMYTRLTRSAMVDALNDDYVRTLRAKGLSKRDIYIKHAFRGALSPVATILGIDIGILMAGTVITEFTFSLNGIGRLAVLAVEDSDLPMMMGVVLVAAAITIIANLLVDVAYAVIDPRVRLY